MNLVSTSLVGGSIRAAATLLAAIALLTLCTPHAFATHAEAVSIVATDTSGGASGVTYTIGFRIGAGNGPTFADQGDVTITFPAGYDLSGASVDSFTVGGNPGVGTFQFSGNRMEVLNLPGVLADGTSFVFVISGVKNPDVGSAPVWNDATFATPVAGLPYSDQLAIDVGAGSANQTFLLQVWSQTVGDLPSVNTNGSGSVTISSGAAMSITAGSLPTGLSVSHSSVGTQRIATISGTPSVPGESYSFTLRAENNTGFVEETFSGTVAALSDLAFSMAVSQSTFLAAGEILDINYSIINGGPVDIAALSVSSPQAGPAVCAAAGLLVGESTTCTGTYVVQPSDVSAGAVVLTATAIGDGFTRASATVTVGALIDEVQKTHEATITGFIQKSQALLSSKVYFPGLGQRSRGSGGVTGTGNDASGALSFATSLVQMSAALAATETLAYSPYVEDMPFNLWVEGAGTWHENATSGSSGTFALASLGGDYLVNEDLLIGAALHVDWLYDRAPTSMVSGSGYLVGPYVSAELFDGVIVDAGLFLGRSHNDSELVIGGGTFTGQFETDRVMFDAVVRGAWHDGPLTVRPNANLHVSHESSGAYTATGPGGATVPIGGVDSTFFKTGVGAIVEYDIDLGGGLTLTPEGAFTIGAGNGGQPGLFNQVHGNLSTGLNLSSNTGWSLRGVVDGQMDTGGFRAVTVRGNLRASF